MPSETAKLLGSTFKDAGKLVPKVARHLLKQSTELDDYAIRGQHSIHPSEISHGHWCPRSTYYRLSGSIPDIVPHNIAMQSVFETGNEAHIKWQRWFWEMGALRGTWLCLNCNLYWYGISPRECPRCEVNEDMIRYAEVPFKNNEYLIAGQADGDVLRSGTDDYVLVEIKTVGVGTIRYEALSVMMRHEKSYERDGKTIKYIDWMELWKDIRRPFPAHLRQGMIYLFCSGRDEIIYIYDPKFVTAYPKEFAVKFNKEIIADALDECTNVRNALEAQRPPKRPIWAAVTDATCKKCSFRNECWGDRMKSANRT